MIAFGPQVMPGCTGACAQGRQVCPHPRMCGQRRDTISTAPHRWSSYVLVGMTVGWVAVLGLIVSLGGCSA